MSADLLQSQGGKSEKKSGRKSRKKSGKKSSKKSRKKSGKKLKGEKKVETEKIERKIWMALTGLRTFPSGCTKWTQLPSRFFCNSCLVCLLDLWLRNVPLVKIIGNLISYGLVFVFHLSWCVRGFKRLKWFWPYLTAFRSRISTGKPA